MTEAIHVREGEQVVDYLASEITGYLSKINTVAMPSQVSQYMGCAFHVINDLEQIGDHAVKILDQNEKCVEGDMVYTEAAREELADIYGRVQELMDDAMRLFREQVMLTPEIWLDLRKQERKIIKRVTKAQSNHMERLQRKECTFEQGLTFVEVLNSYLRIVNHSINIAEALGGDMTSAYSRIEQM